MTSRNSRFSDKARYGWAVRLDVVLNSRGGFRDYDGGAASLLWRQADLILQIESRKIAPWLEAAGSSGYRLTVGALETACEAEQLGTRVAAAMLMVALKKNWGLTLAWPDSPLPCRVVDRNASKGITALAYGTISSHVGFREFIQELDTSYSEYKEVQYRTLLSLELCAASRCETSSRSRIVMLVSSIEAMARQESLGEEVEALVEHFSAQVLNSAIEDAGIRASLEGQIRMLTRESARRAVIRLLKALDFSKAERDFVEQAYSARSKILHQGRRVPGLDHMVNELDRLIVTMHNRAAQHSDAADDPSGRR